ncbi:MAG: AsmA family protein [Rhizomicrobium sp.]
MAVAPERSERDSLGKTLGSAARRTGAWAHAALLGTEWTWLRILTWTAGVLIALIVAAVVWLYFLDWNTMRGPVARYASMRLGRPVRIDGDLDVHLFSLEPSVSVSGLKVANPDWAGSPQAADIQHLAFTFRLIPALFGDTILPLVQFDHPDIKVVRLADGRTNWDMGGGKTGWNVPPIRRFLVRDGHITVDDRVRGLKFVGTVSSEENAGARGSAFQLSGDGTLNGNKFTAQVHGGPLIHVDESKPYRFVADVRAGATHAVADGAIAHPFHLGQFSAAVTVSGPNLSDLYYLTGLVMPQTAPLHDEGHADPRRYALQVLRIHRHRRFVRPARVVFDRDGGAPGRCCAARRRRGCWTSRISARCSAA